jgi:hypothetical protein
MDNSISDSSSKHYLGYGIREGIREGKRGSKEIKIGSVKLKQPKGYTPTFYAAASELKGKSSNFDIVSGLGLRPVQTKRRRK